MVHGDRSECVAVARRGVPNAHRARTRLSESHWRKVCAPDGLNRARNLRAWCFSELGHSGWLALPRGVGFVMIGRDGTSPYF
jgi:hypothetical protein